MSVKALGLAVVALVVAWGDAGNEAAWYAAPVEKPLGLNPSLVPIIAKTAIDFCQLPPDVGRCSQELIRYYYEPTVDECKKFIYSGCGGNSNRFMRRAHCRNRCVKSVDDEESPESKHRRTLTTASTTTTTADEATTTSISTTDEPTTTTTKSAPVTAPVQRVNLTKLNKMTNALCRDCDPIYGTCVEGVCGCMKGFRQIGKICVDVNECDDRSLCPSNSRCVNGVGTFTCECDGGFAADGKCTVGPDACEDAFDVNLTEEDCSDGHQEIRYYYDVETAQCKNFFYGGCATKSMNFFADLQTCDELCAKKQREYLKTQGVSMGEIRQAPLPSLPIEAVKATDAVNIEDYDPRPPSSRPRLDLNLSQGTTPTFDEKVLEATKAERLAVEIDPGHDKCKQRFDEVLREECLTAAWEEKFFYNIDVPECEPFWYDTSCDPRERAGKNFFDSYDACKKSCEPEPDQLGKSEEGNTTDSKGRDNDSWIPVEPSTIASVTNAHPTSTERTATPVPASSTDAPTTVLPVESKTDDGDGVERFMPNNKIHSYLEDELVVMGKKNVDDDAEKKADMIGFNPNSYLKMHGVSSEVEPSASSAPSEDPVVVLQNTPDQEDCMKDFNSELRSECTTASWEELFYWNSQFKECEAFWYDSSCGQPSFEGNNVFPTWNQCNEKCSKKPQTTLLEAKPAPTTKESPTTSAKAMASPTVVVPSAELSTPKNVFLAETEPSPYAQKDPLNVILNEALNPNKESALPSQVPPKHREEFLNFMVKSGTDGKATTKFDRLKYMAEFKKKLMALPDGITTQPTFVDEKPTRRIFTLPPYVLEDTPSTEPPPATTVAMTSEEYLESEKRKVEEYLDELARPADFCDEPLHPKLEEDCSNDQWVIKWYFNGDRGACKSFWYGGCEAKSKNFFPDHANCKAACAHKYVKDNLAKPQVQATPGGFAPSPSFSPNRLSTSLKLTFQNSEDLFPKPLQRQKSVDIDGGASKRFGGHTKVQKHGDSVEELQRVVPSAKDLRGTKYVVTVSPESKTEEPLFYNHIDRVFADMKEGRHGESYTIPEDIVTKLQSPNTEYLHYEVVRPSVTPDPDGWIKTSNDEKETQPTQTEPSKLDDAVTTPEVKPAEKKAEVQEEVRLDDVNVPIEGQSADIFVPTHSPHESPSTEVWLKTTKSIDDPCEDEYDPKWDDDCLGDEWVVRSYYDRASVACKGFWYGGCTTSSRNIWFDKKSCRTACAHKFPTQNPLLVEGAFPMQDASSPATTVGANETTSPPDTVVIVRGARGEPLILKIKARFAMRFKSDLDRQLGKIKRDDEGRQDVAYSARINHPVTVAADCLESFDASLAKPCNEGRNWTNRFYYDADLRACRMFWNDGCFSPSLNNFADAETCQWKCEGRHPQPAGRSCLDKFDRQYLEDCRHGEFTSRFYFDHDRKKCVSFAWGGCQSKSQNFFTDMGFCQELCESPPRELTQACVQPFDEAYLKTCSADYHQQYYYFDVISGTCKMFWFGNCKGHNQNIFPSIESCQWTCERKREERVPTHCADAFDSKYMESCGESKWTEKWYFEQSNGECVSFWWDGCTSTSQNIFPDEKSCNDNCVHPGFEIASRLPDPETKFRCLEAVEIGGCRETYPAYYYDRAGKVCRPFAYSGCGGNGNRFMTLSQCENLCYAFNHMSEPEMDCHLPMHIGYGKNDEHCLPQSGFRFYYDRDYGRCSQMWYLGCGGNANNFFSYEVCQRSCAGSRTQESERRPRASSIACFAAAGDKGKCAGNSSLPLQRWTFSQQLRCVQFTYSGCGGNANRFATEVDCEQTCKGLRNSLDPATCSHHPDWGTCNQLRYMWFYNQTRGTCDQFLYGGCGGNPNRFESFEVCQKTCEVSGIDPCLESLDRGSWCEAMSNRYYFNKRTRQCKGFHYTGCGKSGNNFLTKEECQQKCEKRFPRSASPLPAPTPQKKRVKPKGKVVSTGYSGIRPVDKTPMNRHFFLGVNGTYFKSPFEWMNYDLCYGYRYNVSGLRTVLNVHFCSMDGGQNCISESYRTTEGEEFCNVIRPFLRGSHLYSWYFGLDIKDPTYDAGPASGRIQRPNETEATVLLLKANQCHEIC